MKLIIAIVHRDDANRVTESLSRQGFSSTRLSTTGGYLRTGNATILTGVEKEKVQEAIDIIKAHSHARTQIASVPTEMGYGYYPTMPVEVTVGGATIFVVDVDRFERV